jgi:hypothetical protein
MEEKQTPGSTCDPGALRDDCSSAPFKVELVADGCGPNVGARYAGYRRLSRSNRRHGCI